jgi:hypothetical protein
VLIPGQEPIRFGQGGFAIASSDGALAGSFTGDASSTTLVAGVEELELVPETEEYTEPRVIDLGLLGNITVQPRRLRVFVPGSYEAVNRKHGLTPPAPGTPGCGIGPELAVMLPLLGALRRRRRPAA